MPMPTRCLGVGEPLENLRPIRNGVEASLADAVTEQSNPDSTRLKAGTATKVVRNILSTGAMVRLGRVTGNAMGCLQPTNAKLRDRAVLLVAGQLGLFSRCRADSPGVGELEHP
jgi:N-acetylmuramic acid 6-phosphate etherase